MYGEAINEQYYWQYHVSVIFSFKSNDNINNNNNNNNDKGDNDDDNNNDKRKIMRKNVSEIQSRRIQR